MLAGLPGNALGHFWLHHASGAFCNKTLQINTVDEVDGVDHIALGFGHFLPFPITHKTVDVDRMEGHFAAEMQGHHDHSSDPEKDDVETRYQNRSRVEDRHFVGFFRPSQR